MPTFYYTAKSQEGKTKTGTLEAKDEHALAQALRSEDYILTSAKSLEIKQGKKKNIFKLNLGKILKRISLIDKLMFARHLAVMIGAGFSLNQGLEVLTKQTENPNFRKILVELVENIKKGQSFADSLTKYPKVFNDFFINMVRVGEKGGNLEEVLDILAQHLKKEHDLRSKIRGAMFYPAIILVAMVGIAILMMIVVIPKLTAVFEEMNFQLPLATRILIGISKFISNYFYIGVIAFLILAVILTKFFQTKKGKQILSFIIYSNIDIYSRQINWFKIIIQNYINNFRNLSNNFCSYII